jgi:hypothetical protein
MEQAEIDKLIAAADRRAVYINQVEHAKERFHSLNVLYWEGHIFELNHGFLSYVYIKYMDWLTSRDRQAMGKSIDIPLEPILFLDKNDEPVLIKDMNEFIEAIEEMHTEALNDYHDIYSRLQLARNTEELIEAS